MKDRIHETWALIAGLLIITIGVVTCNSVQSRERMEIKRIQAQQKCGQQQGASK